MAENSICILSPKIINQIDNWLKRYPVDQKRSGVIEALRFVQEEHGHLTEPLMNAVADHLEISKISVYEVATFYHMFYLKPIGKHVLDVCTNISCMLRDVEKISLYCKKKLKIDWGETTADGKYTLQQAECLGACANAPVIQVGKKYYEDLTPEKIDKMLDELT
ncbi:NADH-quinone oxidoreductase subunit NuoE [Gammaproteobacteria bacterium]|nr:NADH-quinone oxidoreductase subunit NuoE [Gammaproteobacteria bacterium]